MYRTNKKRNKKLMLAYYDTKMLYYLKVSLIVFLIIYTCIIIFIIRWAELNDEKIKNNIFGDWDIVFIDVNIEDLMYFQKHAFIKDYFVQSIQEKVHLENNKSVIIGSCDDKFINLSNIKIIDGKMPRHSNEVAIEEEYLSILGVNEVGDIIPNDSMVEALRGYKVCGIMSNYSTNWHTVNWKLNLVNCFVKDKGTKEVNIFINSDHIVQKDLIVNNINYSQNIEYTTGVILNEIIKIWFIVLIIIFIIFYLLRKRLNKRKNFNNDFFNIKSYTFIKLILCFINIILIIDLVNEYIVCNPINMEISHNLIENQKILNFNFIDQKYYYKTLLYSTNYPYLFRNMYFVPINRFLSVANIACCFMYTLIINTILIFIELLDLKKLFFNNDFFFLEKYFYNKIHYNKLLFKWKLSIVEFIIYLIVFNIKYMNVLSNTEKFKIIVPSFCILVLMNLFRVFILLWVLKRKYCSISLLTTN